MSFYVTLPSNSSMGIYPNNQPGHFFVELPQTIELSSQYEVGLAEIQFPRTYFNILQDDVWIEYSPPEGKASVRVTLPPGLYTAPDDLIDPLNQLIMGTEVSGKTRVRFNVREEKAIVKLYEKGAKARISEPLKEILKVPSDILTDAESLLVGMSEIQLDTDMKNIFVYCDIVASRPVGDVMVPLLRTVPILDKRLAPVFRIYDKPHYVPLSRFSFDTIEILLTTDTGKTIPFGLGSSVLTLHFRSKRRVDLE